MNGKMKVAVMNGIGKMGFEEREIPKPKKDEVLVKLRALKNFHFFLSGSFSFIFFQFFI